MKKLIFFIITLLFITGCETKVTDLLKQNETQIILMQNTQRGQIINALNTVAIINATYLNPILKDKDSKKYEVFLIGVYNSEDFKDYNKGGIFNPNYTLTLNNSNFERAKKANLIKMQLKEYPFYNAWMKYYIVYFPKTDSTTLKLKYTNKLLGSVTLIFNK